MFNPIRKKKKKKKKKRNIFSLQIFFITFTKISILNLSTSIVATHRRKQTISNLVFVSFLWRNIIAIQPAYTNISAIKEERREERGEREKERRIYWRNSRANVESASFIATSDWTNHANTWVGTHYGYTTQRELKEMLSKLARRFDRLG